MPAIKRKLEALPEKKMEVFDRAIGQFQQEMGLASIDLDQVLEELSEESREMAVWYFTIGMALE